MAYMGDKLAFPVSPFTDGRGVSSPGQRGMTLKEYYAGQALIGLLANKWALQTVDMTVSEEGMPQSPENVGWNTIGAMAWDLADAMIETHPAVVLDGTEVR